MFDTLSEKLQSALGDLRGRGVDLVPLAPPRQPVEFAVTPSLRRTLTRNDSGETN